MNFKKKKEINSEEVNMKQDDIYHNFVSNNQNDNINGNIKSEEDSNNANSQVNNSNQTNDNQNKYVFKEKEYNGDFLEKHTVVTKASAVSRMFLIGFYLIAIVVGFLAFALIRSNRYEFYLKQDSVLIDTGSSYQIELIPKDANNFDYLNYSYSIADESVAKVDEFGTVTAVGSGTTTLKISLWPGLNNKTVKIISETIDIETVNIAIVKEDESNISYYADVKENQSITIKPIINSREDLNVSASYTSSDPNVATVDAFGNVTSKHSGVAVITANVNGHQGSITINVKKTGSSHSTTPQITAKPSQPAKTPVRFTPTPAVINSLTFSTNSLSIKRGSSSQIVAIISPKSLSNDRLSWQSSDTNIVSVNDNGMVTGVNVGEATITATTSNGKTATCKVVVTNENVNVTRLSLNVKDVTINANEKYQLIATITPSTATVRKLVWTSDNESVATVNQSGLVTGKSAGSTVIMVTSSDGKVIAKCTVTVKMVIATATPRPTVAPTVVPTQRPSSTPRSGSQTTKPTRVSLGVANQTTIYVGNQLLLSATVEPSSITNYSVKWTSSNSSIATVTDGKVVGVKAGTVDIKAEVNGVEGRVTIVVKNKSTTTTPTATNKPVVSSAPVSTPPSGSAFATKNIVLNTTTLTVNKGGSETFTITAKDASGVVEVTSSNTNIVKVDLPVGKENMPICNPPENLCFLDAMQRDDIVTITVKGVNPGTAYINLKIGDFEDIDNNAISGSAKIGVLVK